MRFLSVTIPLLFACSGLQAQYAPGPGKPGTTAMHKDSSAFVAWAVSAEIERGWLQKGIDSLGLVTAGEAPMAIGKAGYNGVVSLGDGGRATVQFQAPVVNEPGWDFAVFENSFDGHFLELAFVDVSSDGNRFVRFPAASLTDTAKIFTGFDTLYPEQINNLAGKYPAMYGTPFDLDELKDSAGLDVNNITHIRIVDVVGTSNPAYCSRDAAGRMIRDPWPTPFASGGFDLDAVGVIHRQPAAVSDLLSMGRLHIWPQPAVDAISFTLPSNLPGQLQIFSLSGTLLKETFIQGREETPINIGNLNLNAGIYLLSLRFSDEQVYHAKFIVSHTTR